MNERRRHRLVLPLVPERAVGEITEELDAYPPRDETALREGVDYFLGESSEPPTA